MATDQTQDPDLDRSLEFLRSIDPGGPMRVQAMGHLDSELTNELVKLLYGDLYQRPHLDVRVRSMLMVGIAAGSGLLPQVRYQLRFALQAGVTPEQLREVLRHVAVMSGWGAASNAAMLLGQVIEELALESERGT